MVKKKTESKALVKGPKEGTLADYMDKKNIQFVKENTIANASPEYMARQLNITEEEFVEHFTIHMMDAIQEAATLCTSNVMKAIKKGDTKAAMFLLKHWNVNPNEVQETGGRNQRDARIVRGQPTERRTGYVRRSVIEQIEKFETD